MPQGGGRGVTLDPGSWAVPGVDGAPEPGAVSSRRETPLQEGPSRKETAEKGPLRHRGSNALLRDERWRFKSLQAEKGLNMDLPHPGSLP